jgi:hypothetical protein
MTGRLVSAAVLAFAASLLITGSAVGIEGAVTIVDPAAGTALNNPTPQISGTATDGGGDVTVQVLDADDAVVASFVKATAGGIGSSMTPTGQRRRLPNSRTGSTR